jgi:hypothetical protein
MPVRRLDAARKAEQILGPPPSTNAAVAKPAEGRGGPLPKVTARVFPEQLEWVKREIEAYRARNPRRPKLTIDLLMRVAIDHLKDADDFDAVVMKHLS